MNAFSFNQNTAATGTSAPAFSFGAGEPAMGAGTSAFGTEPAAGAQPASGALTFGTQPAFKPAGAPLTGFNAPSTSFGGAKPAFGATFGTNNATGSLGAVNAARPQPVQLSEEDLYMSPEDHAKRLSSELQRESGEFEEIVQIILGEDKQNFDIYEQLEQFALLLDQLSDKEAQEKQQIAAIAASQKELYQEMSAKPVNTDAKIAHVARMLVEVEAEIERVGAGSVGVLRDIQEQAVVLERLMTAVE